MMIETKKKGKELEIPLWYGEVWGYSPASLWASYIVSIIRHLGTPIVVVHFGEVMSLLKCGVTLLLFTHTFNTITKIFC